MPLRVVAGQPPAQVAVQHDGVEQRLQRVVASAASPRSSAPACSRGRSAARRGRRAGWSCSRRRRSAGRAASPARAAPRRSSRSGSRAGSGRPAPATRAGRRRPASGRRPAGADAARGDHRGQQDIGRSGRRHRPAGSRSRARAAGRAARSRRGCGRRRAGRARCAAAAAAPRPGRRWWPRPTTSGAAPHPGAAARPRRSGACGSACSSTPWTSEPKVAPGGEVGHRRRQVLAGRRGRRRLVLARGARRSRPRRRCPRPRARCRHRRRPVPRRGSARSRTCAASSVSTPRWNRRTSRVGIGSPGTVRRCAAQLGVLHHQGAAGLPLGERRERLEAGRDLRQRGGTALSPRSRPNSSRREAGVAGVPGRRPPRDHLALCPGERDVGQPQLLAGGLAPAPGWRRRGRRRRRRRACAGRRRRGRARSPPRASTC